MAMLAVTMFACAQKEDVKTARELYNSGRDLLNRNDIDNGIKTLNDLLATYPSSSYAKQAILDKTYYFYINSEYDQAIANADLFIELYPHHPDLDYVYYMKALAYMRERRKLLHRFSGETKSQREIVNLEQALEWFRALLERFPRSAYAEEAANRANYIIYTLADYELGIARYYFQRKNYLAAESRARDILTRFPDSTINEHTLALLIDIYEAIPHPELAQQTKEVLHHNFPDSAYLQSSGSDAESDDDGGCGWLTPLACL